MKRIFAHALPLLGLFACVAIASAEAEPAPVPLPDRNPTRPANPIAPADQVAPPADQVAPPADATVTGAIALPEKKPHGAAPVTPPSPLVTPAADVGKATTVVPLPHHNPRVPLTPPSLLAPPQAPVPPSAVPAPSAPAGRIVKDMPLPDPNPNRESSYDLANMKGTLAPAIKAPPPALDYASILKPILSYDLSNADESNLRDVIRGSLSAASRIKDPAARDFALWMNYRNKPARGADPEAIEQFRITHPNWPALDDLREKAEIALFLNDTSPDKVKAFFAKSTPQTGAGKAALASVYLKAGDEAKARELVVSAWRDHQLDAAIEKKILDRYASMLTPDVHRARIDRLLYPDDPKSAEAALRTAKLLPADEQKKVQARVAVIKRGGNAGKLLDALPKDAIEDDVGLRFNRIQWLRRTKDKERRQQAWKMLLDTPTEPEVLLDLNNWWTERRINCRGALNDGQPRVAYEIAEKHGLVSGDSYIEAEFLAGWIALRFLNEPNTALKHFLALRAAATSSKNIALGEYWLGRTALALGDRGSAIIHFHGAAKYPQYFYGQLGRQSLDPRPAHLEVTPTPLPRDEDIQRFLSRGAVRAIGVARETGYDWVGAQFFLALSRKLTDPKEVVLLAELAKQSGDPQIALRLSKIAFNRDLPVGDYALPVGVIPEFKSLLKDRVDPALVHALSRQESEFNANAKSPVGASGLMQLMPGTARAVAKAYNVKFDASQLTNPAYNTQLGEAHLRDLIDSYNGSYFLSLAAYNAGGGRVAQWIKQFGDPRDPSVDPVDWIERIPFTETRQYVIKIMETLQLYRSRLSGPNQALQLLQDLNRGRRLPKSAELATEAKSD
jgi:soluble lytic murein transglycosylase